ncbi:hypothetical protein C4E24_08225 [ANME-1 cluster archaeon AG-394-G21]|nr:hypothetical protein [ANME-1 cluster archaeon AG-394-G21]
MITEKIREYNKGIKTYIPRIIPQSYRDNPLTLNTIYKWVLIGLLIRFVFMPFACHGDLISTYHRSYLILGGSTDLSLYTIVQLIQSFFLFIYQFFLPLEKLLLWPQNSLSVPTSFWLNEFAKNNMAYRALFLFKIPYLIFDFGSAFIILHLFRENKKGILAFKFWMVNPIGIFAIYIFARYEIIPIFFILLSLLLAKRDRPYLSLFSLGMSICGRIYPLMFLPFYIFTLGKNVKEKVSLLLVGIAPFLFSSFISTNFGSSPSHGKTFFESHFVDYMLNMNFNIGYGQTIYIFVTSYVLLTVYYIYFEGKKFDNLWEYSLMVLLLFYATSVFHPQYFAWFTPFIAIAITKYPKFLGLYGLQIFCFVFYTFYWGRALAGFLFAPVDPSFFVNLASPSEFINNFYPSLKLINLLRSTLSGISLLMLGVILYKKITSRGGGE